MIKNRISQRCAANIAIVALILFTLPTSGCGPSNPLDRQAVSGTITFGGEPLAQGSISFEPTAPEGVTSGAAVIDGWYDIPAYQGLPQGTYVVRINTSKSDEAAIAALPPGTPEPPGIELIPPSYNTESQHLVEVISGSNQFDFTIAAD